MPLAPEQKNRDYIRQAIVVRKDLSMPTGKVAAMVAHAAMSFITDRITDYGNTFEFEVSEEEKRWLTELDPGLEDKGQISFAKIVLEAPNEMALKEVKLLAAIWEVEYHEVWDSGYSHNPAGTLACIALGPDTAEKMREVTGHLKIYR